MTKRIKIARKDVKEGDIVIPHRNSNSHNYTQGQCYIVRDVSPGSEPTVHAYPEGDEKNTDGNNLQLSDCSCFRVIKIKRKGKPIFDILVLPADHRKLITAIVSQTKADIHKTIFEIWGFDETIEKGKGIILLLYGPPGTGKTMCAEGIANLLNKDFVMLSSGNFQSPIPGQTERSIEESFKKAEEKGAIIILDECDSVIYNRDRVGAILAAEINCLLSAIERFEGVCILTTNRSIELDPALERRVQLKLKFDIPDKETRKQIWRNLIPQQAPLGKDVDFIHLSEFSLTGGQIKNAILLGARLACSRGDTSIGLKDFKEGIKRELEGKYAWEHSDTLTPCRREEVSYGPDKVPSIG